MSKIYLAIFLWLAFATSGLAQSFPLVIVNSDQGSQTLGMLGIYTVPDGPGGNQLTRFNVSSKLVASSLTGGTAFPGSGTNPATTSYFHVDIPGTGNARTSYVPAGSTLTNPDCGSNYIHVNNASLAITTAAGGTTNVTIGGSGAKIYSGQNFAVKSSRQIGSRSLFNSR